MRKISRRSFLKAATVACALTALTACGGGDESAAASVAKDENGAYVDTLTITLGRFAEPSAAALFPEGQTFEDNAYTRYIESKLNVDLVDSFEAGGDAYTNQLATCVASGELPDILTVNSYDTFVEMDFIRMVYRIIKCQNSTQGKPAQDDFIMFLITLS